LVAAKLAGVVKSKATRTVLRSFGGVKPRA
jgi:hypothetical protein